MFAVLGHPIAHSLSPAMHNASIKSLKMDAVYVAFDVAPENLHQVLVSMQKMSFGGVNLTVPLKEVGFRSMDILDYTSKLMGAVNTVKFLDDGKLKGFNTDGPGFLTAIEEAFHAKVTGLKVFILGCGGAGRAVALTCASEGARQILLHDIDAQKKQKLKEETLTHFPNVQVQDISDDSDIESHTLESDLVVQCTPSGMNITDTPILSSKAFRKGQMIYDLVYMYPSTKFMENAAKAGAQTANGLGMLLHQGALSFEIWTGKKPDIEAMRKALEEKVYKK